MAIGSRRFLTLALLLAVLPAARAADSPLSDNPVRLLENIQQASRTRDYAGVYLYQQGDVMRSSRVAHLVDGTGERERMEALDGQPRECLRHNDEVQCLVPERKIVQVERHHVERFPGLLMGEPARLADHYDIRVDNKPSRVADRQCRRISIVPRDGLRYGYNLCADVETNLLLKAQTLDASKHIVEQITFTALRQGSDVDPARLGSHWNTADWKVVQVGGDPVDLSAQGWRIPAPLGFSPVMQVSRKMGKHGVQVSQMVLSDGLAAISVFIEPYDAARHGRSSSAGLVRRGAINIYGKRVADFWLTAMGEAPVAALEQLVQAVEFVPGPVTQPR